jgi:hypothetical protein
MSSSSFESARSQWDALNDQFDEHYDELLQLERLVKRELRKMIEEKALGRDTAAWMHHSVDFRMLLQFPTSVECDN